MSERIRLRLMGRRSYLTELGDTRDYYVWSEVNPLMPESFNPTMGWWACPVDQFWERS